MNLSNCPCHKLVGSQNSHKSISYIIVIKMNYLSESKIAQPKVYVYTSSNHYNIITNFNQSFIRHIQSLYLIIFTPTPIPCTLLPNIQFGTPDRLHYWSTPSLEHFFTPSNHRSKLIESSTSYTFYLGWMHLLFISDDSDNKDKLC